MAKEEQEVAVIDEHTTIGVDNSVLEVSGYLQNLIGPELETLGRLLGLSDATVINSREQNLSTYRNSIVRAWLIQKDKVNEKGVPSWSTLVNALRNDQLGHSGIADTISKEKLHDSSEAEYRLQTSLSTREAPPKGSSVVNCSMAPSSYETPSPPSTVDTAGRQNDADTTAYTRQVPSEALEELNAMNKAEWEAQFSSVVCVAADYLQKENIDPKSFTNFVNMLQPREECLCPHDPNDFHDILKECMIKEKWDYLNYNPFFAALRIFVKSEGSIEKLQMDYLKSVAQYSATMKIAEWLEKKRPLKEVKGEVIEHHSPDKNRLSAQLGNIEIKDTTISYFKQLWDNLFELFRLPHADYILHSIAIGSIIVTWLIPADPWIEEQIKKLIPYNEEFFKRFNIMCIMINDKPIYHKELPDSATEPEIRRPLKRSEPLPTVPLTSKQPRLEPMIKKICVSSSVSVLPQLPESEELEEGMSDTQLVAESMPARFTMPRFDSQPRPASQYGSQELAAHGSSAELQPAFEYIRTPQPQSDNEGIGTLVQSMASMAPFHPRLEDRPTMEELIWLQGKNRIIHISQEIEYGYPDAAYVLFSDSSHYYELRHEFHCGGVVHMLLVWLRTAPRPTWKDLINALERAGKHLLAQEIKEALE